MLQKSAKTSKRAKLASMKKSERVSIYSLLKIVFKSARALYVYFTVDECTASRSEDFSSRSTYGHLLFTRPRKHLTVRLHLHSGLLEAFQIRTFHSITSYHFRWNVVQISSLVSLGMLSSASGSDALESPKFKCLVSLDLIRSVARFECSLQCYNTF